METCKSLEEVRFHIDKIDRAMVVLMAERSGYVRQAAMFKTSTDDVLGPPRVEQVVAKVRKHAEELGANPGLVEKVYRTMIAGFIQAEMAAYEAKKP